MGKNKRAPDHHPVRLVCPLSVSSPSVVDIEWCEELRTKKKREKEDEGKAKREKVLFVKRGCIDDAF